MNIKFTKLGLEECEVCEIHHQHVAEAGHNHDSPTNEPAIDLCEACKMWHDHNLRARTSREEYQKDKTNKKAIIMSVDLQKVFFCIQ